MDEVLQVTAIVRVPVTAVNENPMLKALFAFHFYELNIVKINEVSLTASVPVEDRLLVRERVNRDLWHQNLASLQRSQYWSNMKHDARTSDNFPIVNYYRAEI